MIGEQQPYQEPQQPPSPPEIIIGNILKAVICIFLIAISFFCVTVVTSTLDTQTAVEYSTYTNDFDISNPTLEQVVFSGNPHLDSLVVTKYNSSNASWGGVSSLDYTYNKDGTALTINANVLSWDINQIKISAETTYAEVPTEATLSMWSISLVIACIMALFGIIAYKKYEQQQNRPPYIN